MKKRFGKGKMRGRGFLGAAMFAVMLGTVFLMPGTGLFASAANKGPAAAQGQADGQAQSGAQTIAQPGGQEIVPVTLAAAVLQDAAVYAQPAEASAVVGTAAAGQALNICGRTADGWYEAVFGNGIGYVRSSALTVIAVDENMTAALAQQAQFVKTQQAALQEQAAVQQAAAQAQAMQQQEALQGQPPAAGNLIFVGDSRTGQMGNAVGGSAAYPGTAFVACFGGGVDWLSGQKAKQDIDKLVTPGSVIILNYGVNDLSRHNDYISLINRYATDWRKKGAAVYFASVGPVGENEYGKRNWAVEYFNSQLNGRLDGSIGRIDLYGYLTASGYAALSDGMHYTADTYARMFQFLCQSVGR